MEEILECTNASLELLVLEEVNWPLEVSISISISWAIESSYKLLWRFEVKRNNVFANSLFDTTIQDSGKRERSRCPIQDSFVFTLRL